MKRILPIVTGVGLLIAVVALAFLTIGFFVLNGLMYIFGGSYESISIALLFLACSFVIGLALDFVVGLLTDAIAMAEPPGLLEMLIIIDVFVAWLPLYVVDEWMRAITLPTIVEFIGAIVLMLISLPSLYEKAKNPTAY